MRARQINASVLAGTLDPKCAVTPDAERAALLGFLDEALPPCADALCEALQRAGGDTRAVVVTVASWPAQSLLLEAFTTAAAALRVPTCVLVAHDASVDPQQYMALEASGVALSPLPSNGGGVLAAKWRSIAAILARRTRVLYADVDAVLTHAPFALLANDSDVEVLTEAWDDEAARGFIHGSDDPSMGWGRCAHRRSLPRASTRARILSHTHAHS